MGLDNADSKLRWLPDALATVATGGRHQARELYSDLDMVEAELGSAVVLTSMGIPFNRADVMDRSIIFELNRLERFENEAQVQARVPKIRTTFWAALLHDLNHLVQLLAEAPKQLYSFRMADYAAVGVHVLGPEAERLLKTLQKSQARAATEDDQIVSALLVHLRANGGEFSGTAAEILQVISEQHVTLPSYAQTPKAISGMLRKLAIPARELGLTITWEHDARRNANRFTVSLAESMDEAA